VLLLCAKEQVVSSKQLLPKAMLGLHAVIRVAPSAFCHGSYLHRIEAHGMLRELKGVIASELRRYGLSSHSLVSRFRTSRTLSSCQWPRSKQNCRRCVPLSPFCCSPPKDGSLPWSLSLYMNTWRRLFFAGRLACCRSCEMKGT
jgi:hypothetical protein